MHALDPKTLGRVAELVCDVDGPFERRGYQLEDLLRSSRWPVDEGYDGSPRVPWLTAVLTEQRADTVAIERFLCRVCDPIEYDDGAVSAEQIRTAINRILEPEGLAVTQAGRRPVIGELRGDHGEILVALPDDLESRLGVLIRNTDLVRLLAARAREAEACGAIGAHTLAVIGLGSFIEGLLLAVLAHHDPEGSKRVPKRNGGTVDRDQAGLAVLIDAASARGWIAYDATQFIDTVRDFRNFVHVRAQDRARFDPDEDTLKMCLQPVLAVLNDLTDSLT